MFAIPVKVVTISGGGAGLPQMTWNPSDVYVYGGNPEDYSFTNTNKTIEGNEVKTRSNHPIVPDRWYFEIKITNVPPTYLQLVTNAMYGLTTSSASLSDIYNGVSSFAISFGTAGHQAFNTVYIQSESALRFLSTDGVSVLTEINEGDVFQFAGDLSNQTLWVGLNGYWLYVGDEVYDELNEIWEINWSTLGDPETDGNPVLDDIPTTPYVFTKTGESFGPTPERNTLLTHADDLIYTPPSGFSTISGSATVTYQNVLRDRTLLPISQPTNHTLMGALGL